MKSSVKTRKIKKVPEKKIAQLQMQINLLQSEIDLLRGDYVEFKSENCKEALDWLNSKD